MTHGWPGSVHGADRLRRPAHRPDRARRRAPRTPSTSCCPPCRATASRASRSSSAGTWPGPHEAWAELMRRLGYTRYVAQGGDVGAGVTDAMGRQAPEGLIGIHTNLLVPALNGPMPTEHRRGTRCGRADRHLPAVRQRLLRRDGHPPADDRLRPARLAHRPGRLDDRPRHRRLLQDHPRLRRRAALGQPHPGQRPGQHHGVLADRHRRLRGAVVLGGLRAGRSGRGPQASAAAARSRSPSRRSPARSGGPRAAGSRRATRTSSTSTRSTRAATSPPGRSRSSSRTSFGTRSGHCAERPGGAHEGARRSRGFVEHLPA